MRIGLIEFLLILAIASLTIGPQVALFVDRWMRRANRANARAARRRAVILLGERRVEHGVALLPAEMAALARVAVQQAGYVRVLLPALVQIVGRHFGAQLVVLVLGGVT